MIDAFCDFFSSLFVAYSIIELIVFERGFYELYKRKIAISDFFAYLCNARNCYGANKSN